jgi:hypothetical protein
MDMTEKTKITQCNRSKEMQNWVHRGHPNHVSSHFYTDNKKADFIEVERKIVVTRGFGRTEGGREGR